METSNRPCGGDAGFQRSGLKIHVWTVRFCPWAPRSNRKTSKTTRKAIASAIARGKLSLPKARALFGVAESLRAPRAAGPLARPGLRSALGGAQ